MSNLTLAEGKRQLNLVGSEFDTDVQELIDKAEAIIHDYLKLGIASLPATDLIEAATRLVLTNLFDQSDQPLSEAVKAILHRNRDPALA